MALDVAEFLESPVKAAETKGSFPPPPPPPIQSSESTRAGQEELSTIHSLTFMPVALAKLVSPKPAPSRNSPQLFTRPHVSHGNLDNSS